MPRPLGTFAVPEPTTPLGKVLVRNRISAQLNVRQVAALTGLSKSTYSAYEHGVNRPLLDDFIKLATAFGVTPQELLTQYIDANH